MVVSWANAMLDRVFQGRVKQEKTERQKLKNVVKISGLLQKSQIILLEIKQQSKILEYQITTSLS